jgi:hypothetical protein
MVKKCVLSVNKNISSVFAFKLSIYSLSSTPSSLLLNDGWRRRGAGEEDGLLARELQYHFKFQPDSKLLKLILFSKDHLFASFSLTTTNRFRI